jgi:hypothetical protein
MKKILPLPLPSPKPKGKKSRHFEPPIECMKVLFPKLFIIIFGLG